MTPALLTQIYALEMQARALVLAAEAEMAGAAPTDGACPHPDEKQMDATVMGGLPTILCLECNQERPGSLQG